LSQPRILRLGRQREHVLFGVFKCQMELQSPQKRVNLSGATRGRPKLSQKCVKSLSTRNGRKSGDTYCRFPTSSIHTRAYSRCHTTRGYRVWGRDDVRPALACVKVYMCDTRLIVCQSCEKSFYRKTPDGSACATEVGVPDCSVTLP